MGPLAAVQGERREPQQPSHLQVWVDAAQVVLLQLGANVLRDQVDRHHVVAAAVQGRTGGAGWRVGVRSCWHLGVLGMYEQRRRRQQ